MTRGGRAKWTLPDVVDPPDRLCFEIEVPNNLYHIAAFRGALLNLASAIFWQDDPAHTAKDVAMVWDEIVQNIRSCPDPKSTNQGVLLEDLMSQQIRLKPDDPCIIQMWCVDDWVDWYNPAGCVVNEVTQPTDGTAIAADDCREWDVTLTGNGVWLLPVQVSSGYTITVEDATGGWSDGGLQWACPSGMTYAAGVCVSAISGQGTDPIPSANHMRLIAKIGSTFVDAYNRVLSIPASTTNAQVIFQANDGDRSDNAGSVQFKVKVCNSVNQVWSKTYDFSLSSTGATPLLDSTNSQPLAVYGAGQGWNSVFQTAQNDTLTGIAIAFPAQVNLTGITTIYNDTAVVTNGLVYSLYQPIANFDYTQNSQNANGAIFAWSGDVLSTGIAALIYSSFTANSGSTRIVKITITGRGFNPFA